MKWRIFPRLDQPDWEYWKECFPGGIGTSAFSAPAWQKLIHEQLGQSWQQLFLKGVTPRGDSISLPVFAKTNRWGRTEIRVHPVAAYVTPIESDINCSAHTIQSIILEAARAALVSKFTWWLPPWYLIDKDECKARYHSIETTKSELVWNRFSVSAFTDHQWGGILQVSPLDTYLICLNKPLDRFLKEHVSDTQRRYVRQNLKRDLEVITNPSFDLVDEYYKLYLRVWDEQGWTGEKLSAKFFHGVNSALGSGGELIVMCYAGNVVGGGLLLYDKFAVHYCQGAVDRSVKKVHPTCALYMRALEQAEARGLRYVNLGGVNRGNEGLIRFKKSWGACATQAPAISWLSGRRVIYKKATHSISKIMKSLALRRL